MESDKVMKVVDHKTGVGIIMKKNVGSVDRIVRIVIGLAMIAVGFFVLEGTLGTVVGIVGFLPLLTGLAGRCLLYYPFKIDTATK